MIYDSKFDILSLALTNVYEYSSFERFNISIFSTDHCSTRMDGLFMNLLPLGNSSPLLIFGVIRLDRSNLDVHMIYLWGVVVWVLYVFSNSTSSVLAVPVIPLAVDT